VAQQAPTIEQNGTRKAHEITQQDFLGSVQRGWESSSGRGCANMGNAGGIRVVRIAARTSGRERPAGGRCVNSGSLRVWLDQKRSKNYLKVSKRKVGQLLR